MNEYLFPHRLTRRDFLSSSAAAVAGLAVSPVWSPAKALADEEKKTGEDWRRLLHL